METINLKLSHSGKNVFAQVEKNEKILITNKKGKFSPNMCRNKDFDLFVIRAGYYVITSQNDKIIIAKVVSFSEEDNEAEKVFFAICNISQQKENEKWSATPPKFLERAIKKVENTK